MEKVLRPILKNRRATNSVCDAELVPTAVNDTISICFIFRRMVYSEKNFNNSKQRNRNW